MPQLDLDTAGPHYEESLAISRASGDTAGVISALNALAFYARHRADHAYARTLFAECVELLETAGDDRALARSLINLGQLTLNYDDDPVRAEPIYARARAIAERLGDRSLLAMCDSHFGDLVRLQGDLPAARALYERALAAFRSLGDRSAVAMTLIDLGELMSDQQEFRAAYELLAQALGVYREQGYVPGITRVLDVFARCAAARGQHERAVRLAAAAAVIREAIGLPVPFAKPDIDRIRELEVARRALGAAGDAAERDGRLMSIENAIEYALSAQG
jgi:tetratricopeptide (TPR) repeat protein